jgi:hypothetical protein
VRFNTVCPVQSSRLEKDIQLTTMYLAFGTALSLAGYDAKKEGKKKTRVKKSHVQRVVQMSRLFTEYLASAKGRTPEQIAKTQKIRDDNFGEPAKLTKLQQKAAERNEVAAKKKSKKVEEEEEENDNDEGEEDDEDEDDDDDDDDDEDE